MKIHSKYEHRSGFTLIEILAVIAIMSLLMGMVVGVGSFAMTKARTSKACADIQNIYDALAGYSMEFGIVPDISPSTDTTLLPEELREWLPPGFDYEDPWGRPYQYVQESERNYTVFSKGKKEDDKADDVYSGS